MGPVLPATALDRDPTGIQHALIWVGEARWETALMALLPTIQCTDLSPRTIPLLTLESVAMGRPNRAVARVHQMSAIAPGADIGPRYVRFQG